MTNGSPQFSAPPLAPSPNTKWWAMLGVGLGILMFTLDSSIVNIAMPTLVQELHTSFAAVQWVVLSYLLVVTALVLGAARLGDMWGKKRLFLWGLILFTISSLLCGIAPTAAWLIAFRALQGLGAVFISALGAAIVAEVFPPAERGKALGIIGAAVSLGIALGPTVGGILIAIAGWRLIFLVNVPIGIFASFIVARFIPLSAKSPTKQQFDAIGALLATAVLTCFALGMTDGQDRGFTHPIALALLAASAIGLTVFLMFESRLSQPMLDLRLFHDLQFSLSLLMALLVFIVITGVIFILPFFLELVNHYPTQEVGLLLAVSPVLGGIVAPFSGSLSDRFGPRIISLIGLVLMVGGCLAISTIGEDLTELGYILRMAPFGIGLGMFQSPNNSAILGAVPREKLGIASGLMSLSRTLGQTAGLPLLGAIFAALTLSSAHLPANSNVTTAPASAMVYGVQGTFRIAAIILLAATVITGIVWRMERASKREV